MRRNLFFVFSINLLIFSSLVVFSCRTTEDTVNCFPSSPINVTLNLNLPAYQNLWVTGGWIYVDEQQSGTRGLIIVRTSTGFKIYDRNAPHICPENNTTLNVENNIKIICPKDGAEWILLTGEPIAVAQTAPKTYPYNYDDMSKILTVYY